MFGGEEILRKGEKKERWIPKGEEKAGGGILKKGEVYGQRGKVKVGEKI